MQQKKLLLIFLAGVFSFGTVMAQDSDFDLGSQRSESQDIWKIPGEKIDHKGLVVNPTPQHMELKGEGMLDITPGVNLKTTISDKRIDWKQDLNFLTWANKGVVLKLSIGKMPSQNAKNIEGAYTLSIDKTGINIVGYDDKGVFYAIQTLRQLIESPSTAQGKRLPYLYISDYPVFPYRGVVEGFYGTPWSHEVRLSLINFYGRNKMNTYIYGPKDDAYHSSPNWRLPYPEKEGQNIHELVEACKRNRVDFVWAIHPGKDIKWNEEDYNNLVHKFELMYDAGVRSFAIFFDDIEGEGTNPNKQVELLNRLTTEFVKKKGDISPLILCPTDYSKLWANPTPQGSLSIYGQKLDPSIKVFWTGDVVCSDVTRSTLEWVNTRIKRPAFFWWNYPVTDYVRHIVLQGPVYGLDKSLTSQEMSGLVSNPMEHGEASKLSLYSVADYTWNPAAYNAIDSWERGLEAIAPQAKEAYRTFAIHSGDTETGYRRDESWETKTFRMANYTPEQYDTLFNEFEKIERVPAEMTANCENKALLAELNPWLIEFGKLGTRGKNALRLMDLYKKGDTEAFWETYVNNFMSPDDRKAYEAHRSGTMKLQPFYEMAMADLGEAFYQQVAGKKPFVCRAIGSYPNLKTVLSTLMFDNDTTSFYTSTVSQQTGEWVGVDLSELTPVNEIHILQGRNSVDDVDYYDHATLEYSVDGQSWKSLIEDMQKQYDVRWTGSPVYARYIRLRKLPSEKKNWIAIRSFEVNPARADRLGFDLQATDLSRAVLAFDKQPTTSFDLSGTMSFGVNKGVTAFTLLMKLPENGSIKMNMYDKKGRLKAENTITSSIYRFDVPKKVTKISLEGKANIFEVIAR